jgi:calcineurin-like phosphoesterase family protein
MRFFTADWHLGETRLEIMQRPFRDCSELWNTIIERHNRVVGPDDFVDVVGDVVSKAAEEPKLWLSLLDDLNGKKRLFRGNHDVLFTNEQLSQYFYKIVPEGEGVYETIGGIPCYITHYPTQGVGDAFNIVGHVHSSWKVQLNMLNVGVDVQNFAPVPETKIKFFLDAITGFYDEDVWCSGHAANAQFNGIRGKKGRYFNPKETVK